MIVKKKLSFLRVENIKYDIIKKNKHKEDCYGRK